jgi:hypothetical protein
LVPKDGREQRDVLSIMVPDYKTKYLIQAVMVVDECKFYRFGAFNNHLDFLKMQAMIPLSDRGFFETILEDHPQKIYFDVDIGKKDLKHGHTLEYAGESLFQFLINAIILVMNHKLGIEINLNKSILVFTSHSDTKRSYHVILPDYALPNAKAVEAIARDIFKLIPEEFRIYMDEGMYKSIQQFRIYGSQKSGSGRPKVFRQQWTYNDHLIEYQYPQFPMCSDPNQMVILKYNWIFEAAGVTLTKQCSSLPTKIIEEIQESSSYKPSWAERGAFEDVEELELTEDRIKKAVSHLDPLNWNWNIEGNRIVLKRLRPSPCQVCKRPHEHENAYMWISPKSGKIFFACWRAIDCEYDVKMIPVDKVPLEDKVSTQHQSVASERYKQYLKGQFNVKPDITVTPIITPTTVEQPTPTYSQYISQQQTQQLSVPPQTLSLVSVNFTLRSLANNPAAMQ